MYVQGWTTAQVAQELGVSYNTAKKRMREEGLDTSLKRIQRYLELHRVEISERYLAGETLVALGAAFDVLYSSIATALDRWGVERRDWFGDVRPDEWRARLADAHRIAVDTALVRQMYEDGQTCQEIADSIGVSNEKIRSELARLGVARRMGKADREKNTFWRGGLSVDKAGYILEHAPEHPNATRGGYVRQHRLVMERHLGRYLLRSEVVDHLNGDTSDNRIENLQLFASNAEHLRATLAGTTPVSAVAREEQRQSAVQRARQRVDAILAASENGDSPSQ